MGLTVTESFDRGIAVFAEIVDAFEPNHSGDAGERQHIPVEPVFSRRPAGIRFLRRILDRPHHLVTANAGVHRSDLVAITVCSRRASTSRQRSSPFIVEAVPSVIESPNATIARASAGAIMSSASRKYQDAVLNRNADRPRYRPWHRRREG